MFFKTYKTSGNFLSHPNLRGKMYSEVLNIWREISGRPVTVFFFYVMAAFVVYNTVSYGLQRE